MLQRHTELAQEHKHNDLFLRILFGNDQFQEDYLLNITRILLKLTTNYT